MDLDTALPYCDGVVGGVMLDRWWIDCKPAQSHPSTLLRMQRRVLKP